MTDDLFWQCLKKGTLETEWEPLHHELTPLFINEFCFAEYDYPLLYAIDSNDYMTTKWLLSHGARIWTTDGLKNAFKCCYTSSWVTEPISDLLLASASIAELNRTWRSGTIADVLLSHKNGYDREVVTKLLDAGMKISLHRSHPKWAMTLYKQVRERRRAAHYAAAFIMSCKKRRFVGFPKDLLPMVAALVKESWRCSKIDLTKKTKKRKKMIRGRK